jgi:hypothetical protein
MLDCMFLYPFRQRAEAGSFVISRPGCFSSSRLGFSIFLALTAAAFCQITAPSPVLSSISPLGAKPGTQIQLTLRGTDLDAPLAILLGQHRLPISTIHQAKLTLPETLAPGLYDLRLVGRWGVSNPRVFEIAPHPSVPSHGTNTRRDSAQPILLNTAIEGHFASPAPLWFRFQAPGDQPLQAHYHGHRFDTRTELVATVFDAKGRELARMKNSRLRFTPPAHGDYWLRLHELMHRSGEEFGFRITLSPATPANGPLSHGQAIRPIHLPETVQGTFGDGSSTFELAVKKGDSFVIQILSHQLGHATDPHLLIETVKPDGSTSALAEIADAPALTPAPSLRLDNRDPIHAYEAKADATLRLQLSDNFATHLPFELRLRRDSPRRLVALQAQLPNAANARSAQLGTANVTRGGILALEVAALNRTSLSPPVEFKKEQVAEGLTCLGGFIGSGQSVGYLAFQAAPSAPPSGLLLNLPTESATVLFPVADSTRDSVLIRYGGPPAIGVSTFSTPALVQTLGTETFTAAVDGKIEIPLQVSRHADFTDALKLSVHGLGDPTKAATADIAAKANSGKLVLDLKPLKLAVGDYGLILQGPAKMKVQRLAEELAAAHQKAKAAAAALHQAKTAATPQAAELVKAAEKAKAEADKALQDLSAKATAKDATFLICSNPFRLHLTAPTKP